MEKLLIFDFDGVLADTFELSYKLFKAQLPMLTRREYRRWFDENLHAYLQRNRVTLDMPRFFAGYAEALKKLKLAKGWQTALPILRNTFSMAIVSSSHEDGINGYLFNNGIQPLFDNVWGVQKGKSKVEKIQNLIEETGVSIQDSQFITDTLGDINEVKDLGMQTVAFSSGFHSRTRLAKGKPDKIAATPDEVSDFLLAH